jgi:hypothetical protein
MLRHDRYQTPGPLAQGWVWKFLKLYGRSSVELQTRAAEDESVLMIARKLGLPQVGVIVHDRILHRALIAPDGPQAYGRSTAASRRSWTNGPTLNDS